MHFQANTQRHGGPGGGGPYPDLLHNYTQLQGPPRLSHKGEGQPEKGTSLVSPSHLWGLAHRVTQPSCLTAAPTTAPCLPHTT